MKLELKHFVPYLLYDLEIMSEAPPNSREPNIFKMIGIDLKEERIIGIDGVFAEWKDGFCKPILRPLSDLTKDEYSEFTNNYYFGGGEELYGLVVKRINETYTRLNELNFLFRHHFDVFGLIEKDLAIDINSLK